MCTPSVRALRHHYPETEITFIVSDYACDALRYNLNIDKIVIYPRDLSFFKYIVFLSSLMKSRYDVLIDFQNNPRSYIMSMIIRSRIKIAFSGKRRNLGYNYLVKKPELDIYAGISKLKLLTPLGIYEEKDHLPEMPFSEKDKTAAMATLAELNYSDRQPKISISPVTKKG